MRKYSLFAAGAIMGGLVGGVLVLLFTPASGKNLRNQVVGYTQNAKDEIRNAAEQRRLELEMELNKLRQPR